MDSQVAAQIVTAAATLLAAGIGFFANDRIDRRRRRDEAAARNFEDKKHIVEDILSASAALAELHNDRWERIEELRPEDLDEPREQWRVMARANRRARIYFSSGTTDLIEGELRDWRKMNELIALPTGQKQVERFRSLVNRAQRREVLAAALRREVGLPDA